MVTNSSIKEVLLDINESQGYNVPNKLIEEIIDIEYDELDNPSKAIEKVRDALDNYLNGELNNG